MALQFYLAVISGLLFFGYFIYKFLTKYQDFWPKNGVPVVQPDSMFSRLWMTFIESDGNIYKRVGSLPYAGYMESSMATFFVKDVELLRRICVKDFENFVNRRSFKSEDLSFMKMLMNKEDQEWKDLRSTMSPTFSTGKIRRMFPILNDSSKKLVECLKEEIKKEDGVVNLEDILGRYSMDVISSAAFGIESGMFKNPNGIIAQMSKKISIKFNFWLMFKFFMALFIPFSSKILRMRFINLEADEFFRNLLINSIKHRERTGEKRNDFLQLMIDTKNGQLQVDSPKDMEEINDYEIDAQFVNKKTKTPLDDETLIANCVSFIFGGFDTVTSVLTFVAYSLALNPDVQEKLARELQDSVENQGGVLNYDDINQLKYLDKVISESLRMYPPAARTERRCAKDYYLNDSNNAIIPKDSLVAIPIYQIHHDETHYPNPEVFDPERFSAENKAKRHMYAYIPFGIGPRICIASRFALTQTKAAIANLVMNFEIEPCAKSPIPLKFINAGSLKAVGGMHLKLKPRST